MFNSRKTSERRTIALPLELEGTGRVRFEPIDAKLLRARVQATFSALSRAGMVTFEPHRRLPSGDYRSLAIQGPSPFKYTAYVSEHKKPGSPDTFYVERSGGRIGNASQLAGPFTVMPFSPVPAESGTPVPAMIFVEEQRRPLFPNPLRKPRKLPEHPPLQFPPGVPAFPQILAHTVGQQRAQGSVLGFLRGFAQPSSGAQLAAAA